MASKVFVVGSGAIGLRTAIELLRKQIPVILHSPHPPLHPKTCSFGAGGLWMPFRSVDSRLTKWSFQTLDELLHDAQGVPGSNSGGDYSPVEILSIVFLRRHNDVYPKNVLPEWTKHPKLNFQALTVEMLAWQNAVHKLRIPSQAELFDAGYLHCWLFKAPIVDAPRMLQGMLHEVRSHPLTEELNVETNKHYKSIQEMVNDATRMGCDAIVNCIGFGAKNVCQDHNLIAGRGVVLHYDRTCERRPDTHGGKSMPNDAAILTEEPPWGTHTEPCYLIPRGDVLVVGGSFLEGDTEVRVRPEERERLEKNAKLLTIDTDHSNCVGEWVGFRPYRSGVRLEVDDVNGVSEGVKVVHNYGHGGSGWTLFVGTAKDAAALLGHGDTESKDT